MPTQRRLLVTSALPYANGPLHLGHLVEYIQSDIWVRFHKLQGHHCLHLSGSDAHGTPIMLQAEKRGISPEALVSQIHTEHVADLKAFQVAFDHFYTTHSPENQALATHIYQSLKARGDITEKTITQAYDAQKQLFLPDRYVIGECPRCGAFEQYGDSCEQCGATYAPLELKNPRSVLSGTTPEVRESRHVFFHVEHYSEWLASWLAENHLQPQIRHKLQEWFQTGLKAWDITRDGPYFGFPIPDRPNQYFYVWLDAPIGYMASFQNWCQKNHCESLFDEYWGKDSSYELYHFIGKDIVYFHALFWPALLTGSGFRTPTALFAHGFLTINGQKMSKSRGTFLSAKQYLDHLEPEYLRYYFATKLHAGIDDLDLNLSDFVQRVNSDLIGKWINIASRTAPFITQHFQGHLSSALPEGSLYQLFLDEQQSIQEAFLERQYHQAMRKIMALADRVNQYIDQQKPWEKIRGSDASAVQGICTLALNCFRVLTLFLKPVLPLLAEKIETFLNSPPLQWEALSPLLNHSIHPYQPLLQRIDLKKVHAMTTPPEAVTTKEPLGSPSTPTDPIASPISYDLFAQIDLRIGKILEAEPIVGADKLLKLTVDLGHETRQVFAGIKAAYSPEQLIGKLTVVVANLAPREMRFGRSEAMILAAGPGGKALWLLEPHSGAEPGMRVK